MVYLCRIWFAAAAFVCLSAFAVYGQSQGGQHDIKVAPGKEVRVGVYTNIRPDCSSGPMPAIRLAAAPSHGAVRVRRGTLKATNLKQCLAIEVPALVAFYRATDNNFTGTDEFDLEVSLDGHKQTEHFHVNVAAGNGQGI